MNLRTCEALGEDVDLPLGLLCIRSQVLQCNFIIKSLMMIIIILLMIIIIVIIVIMIIFLIIEISLLCIGSQVLQFIFFFHLIVIMTS